MAEESTQFEQDRETEERQQALALFQEAFKVQMAGQFELALDLYTRSIETFPTAEAYTFRGWTYSMMGRLDEAIAECHRAIATDPDFGNPYNDIGAYLIEQGQLDAALPWLERALRAPRYENYHFPNLNLGRIYESRQNLLRAMHYYSRALELEPRYTLALKAVRRLQLQLN